MPSQHQLTIAIVGLGNVGLALSHLFTKHAHQEQQLHLIAAGRDVEDSIARLKAFDIDIEVTNVQ
ncbi:MAG: UDP-N-acetyl-D-mannosaminuronate dehydrogenase, partial [Dinoroseobacter sp.]